MQMGFPITQELINIRSIDGNANLRLNKHQCRPAQVFRMDARATYTLSEGAL